MSDLVSPDRIESIVGVQRHDRDHYARAVSAEERVYLLHSRECVKSVEDLRDCNYSLALDLGIVLYEWVEDVPVLVGIGPDGRLHPAGLAT